MKFVKRNTDPNPSPEYSTDYIVEYLGRELTEKIKTTVSTWFESFTDKPKSTGQYETSDGIMHHPLIFFNSKNDDSMIQRVIIFEGDAEDYRTAYEFHIPTPWAIDAVEYVQDRAAALGKDSELSIEDCLNILEQATAMNLEGEV